MDTIPYFFILLTALIFPLLLYSTYFKLVKRDIKKIIGEELIKSEASFVDTKIWFKNFDIRSRSVTIPTDPFKPIYSFNIADIYVLTDKIIIIGKTKYFGKLRPLSPFAICFYDDTEKKSNVKYLTRQISMQLVGEDLEIVFVDPFYSNQIRLVVKKIGRAMEDVIKCKSNHFK